jgi:hypothetical protein
VNLLCSNQSYLVNHDGGRGVRLPAGMAGAIDRHTGDRVIALILIVVTRCLLKSSTNWEILTRDQDATHAHRLRHGPCRLLEN